MQIKSGQLKKISPSFNSKNNKVSNDIFIPKKIIINNSADLYKLPVSEIKKTKIYNFSGKYFDEIYKEALKIERGNGIEKYLNLNKKENEIDEGEKYAKAIEDLVNKMYDKNIIGDIKIEQIEDNIYIFNDKEVNLKIDKNGDLKLQNGKNLKEWIIENFGIINISA